MGVWHRKKAFEFGPKGDLRRRAPQRCNWGIRRYSPRDFDGRPGTWNEPGHPFPVLPFEEP